MVWRYPQSFYKVLLNKLNRILAQMNPWVVKDQQSTSDSFFLLVQAEQNIGYKNYKSQRDDWLRLYKYSIHPSSQKYNDKTHPPQIQLSGENSGVVCLTRVVGSICFQRNMEFVNINQLGSQVFESKLKESRIEKVFLPFWDHHFILAANGFLVRIFQTLCQQIVDFSHRKPAQAFSFK